MISGEVREKIEKIATEVTQREGCLLYDVVFSGGGGARILRVFIDKEMPGGAALEDCANVSRGLNLLLDVEDLIPGGQYHLEVSTPGIERPLRKPWHYRAVVGQKVWIRLDCSLGKLGIQSKKYMGHKQVSEVLQSSDETGVELNLENERLRINYENIERAHVVFEFGADKGQKKKASPGKK